jgi:hypothetical protein
MPQIDISTDSLTRLNTVAEKDYQGASLEQALDRPLLGDEHGVPRLDLPADRHQRKVLIPGVGRRGDAAGQHAGGGAQQHAQRAAEHPD